VGEPERLSLFEKLVLPHVSAAYNLARWLTHNEHDAEDLVQEACMRALKSFGSFDGTSGRAWLLTIVRNTCYTWLQKNRNAEAGISFEEELHSDLHQCPDHAALLIAKEDRQIVRQALEGLPVEFREVLVLRELEGLSYRDISQIAGIPVGTVMSRLARGRRQLQMSLAARISKDT
jgi:RNA polymerase sigma-70 factor (ECF subfamily)